MVNMTYRETCIILFSNMNLTHKSNLQFIFRVVDLRQPKISFSCNWKEYLLNKRYIVCIYICGAQDE